MWRFSHNIQCGTKHKTMPYQLLGVAASWFSVKTGTVMQSSRKLGSAGLGNRDPTCI